MESLKRDDLIAMRSIAIGAYTNEKVAEFNTRVREELKHSGALKGREVLISSGGGRILPLMTGEQVVFEENSLRYGISNREVGTILSVKPLVKPFSGSANSKDHKGDGDGILKILVHKADGSKDIVNIDTAADAANDKRWIKLNHGYALTCYKLQGETVDRMHIYFDCSIGYGAFLVLMSRHREEVKLHASAKELEDIVYQRLDSDVEKIREQLKINSYEMLNETRINSAGEEYKVKVKEEIPNWLIGLTLAVSRRANNSFAIDYKSGGLLDGNQLIIKEYLEARSRVFECHGKMREWKSEIESPGNITRLHRNIESVAKALNVELALNSKDLKIDPYGMIFAKNKDISVQDIFKEAVKDQAHHDATRVKLCFSDLSSEQRNSIIASCLPASSREELNQFYSTLQLAKEVMKDYVSLICSSYHISNNGAASMGERIIQLNLNYETIQKHAEIAPYKYYLKDISTT
ncbi:hypothetical protein [Rickettsia amblyommatis]|nr:hypothetical protein [Rickettsia amblyommatis]KJV98588.1 putative conjugative transfer protein TraA [Rickettsia amblyommatis str. Darkwater]